MLDTKHRVTIADVDERGLTLEIDDTRLFVEWNRLSRRLADAPEVARRTIEVSPAGYGLHWPLVDEDLSIDGILREHDR